MDHTPVFLDEDTSQELQKQYGPEPGQLFKTLNVLAEFN